MNEWRNERTNERTEGRMDETSLILTNVACAASGFVGVQYQTTRAAREGSDFSSPVVLAAPAANVETFI